jgi:outer membrane protein assembly factor BamB
LTTITAVALIDVSTRRRPVALRVKVRLSTAIRFLLTFVHALVRTPAAVLAALVLAVAAAATPAGAAPATPRWDHTGYDAEDSWFNPHETVITPATVKRLTKKWSVELRAEDSCSMFGEPLVADGRVFIGDQRGISAYATGDGSRLWSYDWGSASGNPPRMAVADGLLVAGYNDCESFSDPNSVLVGLDVRTGRKRWDGVIAPLIGSMIVDKGVVVTSGSDIYGDTATVAARLSNGEQAWRADGRIVNETSANGTVTGTAESGTVAFDITTGATRWTVPRDLDTGTASPAGDVFYGSSDDGKHLEAVSVKDGRVLWTVPGPNGVIAADGARIYRVEGEAIAALDSRTGKPVWRRDLPDYGVFTAVVAGGVVYVAGIALDAARGTVITGAPPLAGELVVAGGVLYHSNNGTLTAYTVSGSGKSGGRTGRR